MNITFNKIHICNFLSLGDVELNLSDNGYVLVEGVNNVLSDCAKSNGSGKSALFDALVWAITGSTMRGCKDVKNVYADDGAVVTLEFDIDGNNYRIIRSKEHSKLKTNLSIFVNGEDKSGKGIRDSERILSEYLPDLNESILGSVIVLGQGLPARFSSNSPSGRKDVLEKLSKSDFMIEDIKDRIEKRKNELSTELSRLQQELISIQTTISVKSNLLTELQNKLDSLKSTDFYEKEIQDCIRCISEIEEELSEERKVKEQIAKELSELQDTLNKSFSQRNKQFNECEKAMEDELQQKSDEMLSAKADLETAKNQLTAMKSITDICPTCGQKLVGVEKPDCTEMEQRVKLFQEQYDDKKKMFFFAEQTLAQKKQSVAAGYEQLTLDLTQKRTELDYKLKHYELKIKESEGLISDTRVELSIYQTELKSLSDTRQDVTAQIDAVQTEIEMLNSQVSSLTDSIEELTQRKQIQAKFETATKRNFRGYLLTNVIDYINNKAIEYSGYLYDNANIEFKLDGNNISISYNGREYEVLSGGEKQKVDLVIQFSIRDLLCEYMNFSSSILVLDEITDNLDSISCQRVMDLIATKLSDISSIYIISHHADELSIPVDKYLTVIKDSNGISRIKL